MATSMEVSDGQFMTVSKDKRKDNLLKVSDFVVYRVV